jgi:hypothetical protein
MKRHELIQRVFLQDVLACPCGGRLRTIAVINNPDIAEAIGAAIILTHQQPARGPPR